MSIDVKREKIYKKYNRCTAGLYSYLYDVCCYVNYCIEYVLYCICIICIVMLIMMIYDK